MQEEMTMQALNTVRRLALWVLLLCGVVLAPQFARADVVTDWNMTAIGASQAKHGQDLLYLSGEFRRLT
jgi:hypothetical protein